MQKLTTLDMVSFVLVIVGGLNWGLMGLSGFNAVATIFSSMPILARVVYGLVGLAAVYLAINVTKFERK